MMINYALNRLLWVNWKVSSQLQKQSTWEIFLSYSYRHQRISSKRGVCNRRVSLGNCTSIRLSIPDQVAPTMTSSSSMNRLILPPPLLLVPSTDLPWMNDSMSRVRSGHHSKRMRIISIVMLNNWWTYGIVTVVALHTMYCCSCPRNHMSIFARKVLYFVSK